jgi:hypothetical protein
LGQHRHKHLIDRDSCAFTSGITKPYAEWPLIIKSAAYALAYPTKAAPEPEGIEDLIG